MLRKHRPYFSTISLQGQIVSAGIELKPWKRGSLSLLAMRRCAEPARK